MKIISKVSIHPLFYLMALICIFTGLFKDFIMISFIIIIHECGHIIASQIYKWKIDKIVILPFGGITIFKEMINRPIKEELLIVLLGPIFQCSLFFLLHDPKWNMYNVELLLFNLLPIVPLDGSKILNLFCNFIFPFKKSHWISILISIISFLGMISYFILKKNMMMMIVLLFLLFKILKEVKEHPYIFNKFLFERYLYTFPFKKKKIFKNSQLKTMKRDYQHLFYKEKRYYTEKEILSEKFDNI